MEALLPALEHLRAASIGAGPAAALRAETALEELWTNSVMHGAQGQAAQALVWLGVATSGDLLLLRYEDAYPAFDPFPHIELALQRAAAPLESRIPGGLGLLMVYRLADEFRYARANGRNRIDLSFGNRPAG